MSAFRVSPGSQEEQVGRLIIAAVLVTALPSLPLGNYLIYPFTILTTWFHEMGHGLTALALGLDFDQLVILSDGSGYAESVSQGEVSRVSSALIAAGGPIGPSLAGALLILASSRHDFWKPALFALAGFIALSVLIWVRSATGLIVLPLVAATLGWTAWRGANWLRLFVLQFLGLLGAMSMFRDWDYLFSESAVIGGRPMLSDTGAIEAGLFLPHWVWAIVIIALSAAMIGASLKYALNRQG
ncbi:M50 family metallopeptidase [Erythrobacter alti]|uniref:M50 family metallopeptidase n=1 Tax=Erythrobacter alti TaxID=1896145 RepID=UPI0030F42D88